MIVLAIILPIKRGVFLKEPVVVVSLFVVFALKLFHSILNFLIE